MFPANSAAAVGDFGFTLKILRLDAIEEGEKGSMALDLPSKELLLLFPLDIELDFTVLRPHLLGRSCHRLLGAGHELGLWPPLGRHAGLPQQRAEGRASAACWRPEMPKVVHWGWVGGLDAGGG